MTNELKAMFWTMGIIIGFAIFVGLVILTKGVALFVAAGLFITAAIYFSILDGIRWRHRN